MNNDRRVCEAAYEILKDANHIVTHNGKRFDFKFLQTRLAIHGLPFLDPKLKHTDTKSVSSSNLFMLNNKLDTLAEALTDTKKLEHEGWKMWVKVYNRDPQAMQVMSDYCKQDVITLEKVFHRLKGLSTQIPNHNLFNVAQGKEHCCPNCGSTMLQREGTRPTATKLMIRYSCKNCGKWSQAPSEEARPR